MEKEVLQDFLIQQCKIELKRDLTTGEKEFLQWVVTRKDAGDKKQASLRLC
ncbi:hypothetical protein ACFPU1_08755 [Thalassorhabdus alkalitolerans]|uniref:Uncharacterized protein n=1 Tax=Thalassorhabdus alkalitolerans TaxID=2282697 RepID=A0ABW0YKF2_9BACI|nr:hypothetical protein [Thalassobacillus sp. C254]